LALSFLLPEKQAAHGHISYVIEVLLLVCNMPLTWAELLLFHVVLLVQLIRLRLVRDCYKTGTSFLVKQLLY